MPKVSELFRLEYGHSFELNGLEQSDSSDAVNFVGRAARNNGVTARVSPIIGITPAPAGTITVALNGQGGAGVAFLQPRPYYTGFHVMILTPKKPMTEQTKLWWATCITANRFRFGFGRQANRTLKDIDLPSPNAVPGWVRSVNFDEIFAAKLAQLQELSSTPPEVSPNYIKAERVCVREVFNVELGTDLELVRLVRKTDGVNFVSRTARNNGVAARVAPVPGIAPAPGGTLSVAAGGSVLETFPQFEPFYSGRDLFVLTPRRPMAAEPLMFYAACIRANQWRYSYGRQANRTLKELLIPAPEAIPRWAYGALGRVTDQLRAPT